MVYNPVLGLEIADFVSVIFYLLLFICELFIVMYYLLPLRIKSAYIIMFYLTLSALLVSASIEGITRLAKGDPGYMVDRNSNGITVGDYARHVSSICYIILGFVISCTMYQLSCSLALVLNIIDVQEANRRKWTYNICVFIIGLVFVFCSAIQIKLDCAEHREHMIFEVMGLVVLCLIYFSTIVDLIRKLRIFVLEEAKLEAWFVRIQFLIFFFAYGSKVVTLLYWIRNPPHEREDIYGFLINSDVMTLFWIMIPISFLLFMDIRSFKRMKEEKDLLKLVKLDNSTCHDNRTKNALLNNTDVTPNEAPEI